METAVDLRGFLRDYFQLNPTDYEAHLYEYRESDAVRHLFRVTSSLDSMVVGEPQILGQVKEAYSLASKLGCTGALLNKLFSSAFAAGTMSSCSRRVFTGSSTRCRLAWAGRNTYESTSSSEFLA